MTMKTNEVRSGIRCVGNFKLKRDAVTRSASVPGSEVIGYINGRVGGAPYQTGWVVITPAVNTGDIGFEVCA